MNGFPNSPSTMSTMSSVSRLAFDPGSFKKELNRASVSVDTLQVHRKRIQTEADDISVKLKRNVFQNYSLFIDSAKEISLLKSEMYSLSQILTDQQGLLSTLTSISISGDSHGLSNAEKKEVAAKFKSGDADQVTSFNSPERSEGTLRSKSISANAGAIEALAREVRKIEGGSGLLETKFRHLIHSGEVTELDPNDYSRFSESKVLLLLTNDCLILSTAYSARSRGSSSTSGCGSGNTSSGTGNRNNSEKRYKFNSMIELDNIAVVNVKDMNYKSAFKVLMFPEPKVFESESFEKKKKWLDSFEGAKKSRRASLSFQRRDSMLFNQMQDLNPNLNINLSSNNSSSAQNNNSNSNNNINSNNNQTLSNAMTNSGSSLRSSHMSPTERFPSFDEELEDLSESESESVPMWLLEVPDDMDVLIAQRKFDDAVALVLKISDHLTLYPKCYDGFFHNDLRLRINHKIQELIDTIAHELKVSPDRSLQSGPRSARLAVYNLLRLGKTVMAARLFLDQRSAILKSALKNIKEVAPLVWSKKVAPVFTNNLIESCREFERAFKTSASVSSDSARNNERGGVNNSSSSAQSHMISLTSKLDANADSLSMNGIKSPINSVPVAFPMASLMAWTQSELISFLNLFRKNVLAVSVPIPSSVSAECVSILRHQLNRPRNDPGLDLLFLLDKTLKPDLERVITDARDQLINSIKSKIKEDKWESQDFLNKPSLNKFLDEMKEIGIQNVTETYVFEEYKVSLTGNVTSFTKAYIGLTIDALKLYTPFTSGSVIDAMVKTLAAELNYIDQVTKKDRFMKQIKFIRRNASFLLDSVLPLAQALFFDKTLSKCHQLEKLKGDFLHLTCENGERTPSDVRRGSGSSSNSSRSSPGRSSGSGGTGSNTGNGNTSSGAKRSPSKSTISIGTDGKTVTTTTYL